MGVMESNTWYLPSELLQFRNYPEVNSVSEDIDDIMDYSMHVHLALVGYTEGLYDRVDVDSHNLQKYIDKCRNVCNVLGNAPNVCFDLLLELRGVQNVFQQLLYAKNRFGSQYIGTPTPISSENS